MHNVYDPDYSQIRKTMHKDLEDIREYYGDSDELNEKFLTQYLEYRDR